MRRILIGFAMFMLYITMNSWGTIYKQNFIFDSAKFDSLNRLNTTSFGKYDYSKKLDLVNFNNRKFFFYIDIKDMKFINLSNTYSDLGNFSKNNVYFYNFNKLDFNSFNKLDFNSFNELDNSIRFEFNTVYNLRGNIYLDFNASIYLNKSFSGLSFRNLDRRITSNLRVLVKF